MISLPVTSCHPKDPKPSRALPLKARFRVVGFFGLANLSGGSYGIDDNSRDNDGWYTAEGFGVRYMLQQVTGVDLRLDFVHTSEGQYSFYLKLNQAF